MKSHFRIDSLYIALILAAIAFIIKAPAANRSFYLHADAIAYVNIAKNMASGNGFTSTLKLNYFDSSGITHCALADWPPLYPLLAGVMMKTGLDERGLQLMSALFVSLCAGLVCLIGEKLFDRRAGIIAGIFAAIAPNMHRAGLLAMSDALGLVLALAAILTALYADSRPTRWALAGAITGAAYLTRYPNAVLMAVFLPFLFVHRKERVCAFTCIGGFALATMPVFTWKWMIYGSPIYSVQLLHYSTSSFRESSWDTYGKPQAKASAAYLLRHWPIIMSAIWHNLAKYTGSLIYQRIGLRLLALGLPMFIIKSNIAGRQRGQYMVFSAALMNFAVYSLTWSIQPQGVRFLLITFCLLLPFCAAGLVRIGDKFGKAGWALAAGICIISATVYLFTYTDVEYSAKRFHPMRPDLAGYIKRDLPAGSAVATNVPWLVSYETGLPTAALPHNLDRSLLKQFEHRYHIRAFIIFNTNKQTTTMDSLRDEGEHYRRVEFKSAKVLLPK